VFVKYLFNDEEAFRIEPEVQLEAKTSHLSLFFNKMNSPAHHRAVQEGDE